MSINKTTGWNVVNERNILVNRWDDYEKSKRECDRINSLNREFKTGSRCIVIENELWNKKKERR